MTTSRPHVYLIGEVGTDDPVKIGVTHRSTHRSGRGGLQSGNWRELEVRARRFGPAEDVRWWEWRLHRRLQTRRAGIGEWFRVADLVVGDDWQRFLEDAIDGRMEGLDHWELASGRHRLVAAKRRASTPRRFDAICSCGDVVEGDPGRAMPSVIALFAIRHLGVDPLDPLIADLKRSPTSRRRA